MMKKCKYSYLLVDLSDGKGEAFKAVIPKFPNVLVMADTPKELHEQVIYTLDLVIEDLKKDGKPIPPPDDSSNFSGKVLLRIKPQLHAKLFLEAQANQTSLNKYIESKLTSN